MIIAIDFDGTIAEHADNGIIDLEILGSIEAIKILQKRHTIILWTCREGQWLLDAVEWLEKRDIVFDKLNENIHALRDGHWPRKIIADVYIDDRIPGGFQGWNNILELLDEPELVR